MEEGPAGPHKKELMLEFCIGSLSEACMFFLWSAQNDLNMAQQINKQTVLKLEEKVNDLKQELTALKNTHENKSWQYDLEKAHFEAREAQLKENLDAVKQDKEKLETEYKQRLSTEKKEA